jgi:hypothetical protein
VADYSHYQAGVLVESFRIRKRIAGTRDIVAASKELLADPAPGTFIGRKTFEPFPKEDE